MKVSIYQANKLPNNIFTNTELVLATKSMEQAALLTFLQHWLEHNAEHGYNIFDGKVWLFASKAYIIKKVWPHLSVGDGRTYHNIINRMIDGGWIVREWHDRDRKKDAPYYTLGPSYEAIDLVGYEKSVFPTGYGKRRSLESELVQATKKHRNQEDIVNELMATKSDIDDDDVSLIGYQSTVLPMQDLQSGVQDLHTGGVQDLQQKENKYLETEKDKDTNTGKPKKPTRHRAGDTPQLALPLDMSAPLTPESLLHLWNNFEGGKHKPQQLTKERTTQINKIIQGLSPTNDEAEYVVENYRLWSTTQGQDYDSLSNATRYDKFEKRLIDYREGRGKKRLGKVLSSGKDSVDLHSDQPICF